MEFWFNKSFFEKYFDKIVRQLANDVLIINK